MASLCICTAAFGQATVGWVGGFSSNYYETSSCDNTQNWQGGLVPNYDGSDVLGFTAGVTLNSVLTMNSCAPSLSVMGLDVEGDGTNGEAMTIEGNQISIGSSGILVNGYACSPSSLVITAPVNLAAAQTWSLSNASLEVDGAISSSGCGNFLLTLSGSAGSSFLLTSACSSFSDGISVTGPGTILSVNASSTECGSNVTQGPLGTGTLSLGNGTTLATPSSAGQISLGNAILAGSGVVLSPGTCSSFLLSGGISDLCGPGSLEIAGTVILTGSNTYSGGTTIDSGAVLQLGNGGSSGTIMGDVVDNNTLAFDLSGCTTFCGVISGSGGITVENGTVTLMGANTYGGYTKIDDATLKDGAAGTLSANSAVWLTDSASLKVGYNETINGIKGDCGTTICISSGSTLLTDGYNGTCLYTYSGSISGCGGLEVGSNAFQILAGSNSYSGGTTIDCGATLQLGNGGSNGWITGNVTNNGTLAFDLSGCNTFSSTIGGSGGIYVEAGILALFAPNYYSGTTSVNGATLKDAGGESFSPASMIDLTNSAALQVNYFESINGLQGDCSTTVSLVCGSTLVTNGVNSCSGFAGSISGAGAFEVGSGAFQILSGTNSYTGGTTIDCNATLQLGNDSSYGTITGDVFNSGTLAFDLASCTTFCGAISGSGSVLVDEGTVTLAGSNSYSGGTTLNDGATLYVTNCNSLGTGTLFTSSSNCLPTTLAASSGSVTLPNNISVGGSGLTLNFSSSPMLTLTGTISNADCADALIINGSVDLEGCNTYSGGTTINSSSVTIGTSTGLGTGAVTASDSLLTFNCNSSPTLNCATFESDTIATFNGTSAVLKNLYLAESTLNFNGSCATLTDLLSDGPCSGNAINISGGTQLTFNQSCNVETDYAGTIGDNCTGTGTVVLSGSGLLNLSGSNSYGGGTTVNGGLLVAGSNNSLGTGPVTVNSLASLGLSNGVTIANPVTLNGGSIGGFGTLAPASADCIAVQGGSVITGGVGTLLGVTGGSTPPIGTLSFGTNANLVLGSGGVLQFSIMNAAGTPGVDYSSISAGGNANVTATNLSPFTVQLVGVDSTGLLIGTANTFNASQSYTWTLLSAGTITNFNANAFVVDASSYFSNPTNLGTFSITNSGGDLMLNFTPVPEPSTWALMAGGLFALGAVAVRRRLRRS